MENDEQDAEFVRRAVADTIAYRFLGAVPGSITVHDLRQLCEDAADHIVKLIERLHKGGYLT